MEAAMELYYMGLDLGQSADTSALAVVRSVVGEECDARVGREVRRYEVLGLKRYRLGTPYPAIVEDVVRLRRCEPLCGKPAEPVGLFADGRVARPRVAAVPAAGVVVDATGVGRPVVDLFWRAGVRAAALTITGGSEATHPADLQWHVPKRELISVMQVLMQGGRLRVATDVPESAGLRKELAGFRRKISPRLVEIFGNWRNGEHDDLVLAVGLACWAGECVGA